MCAQKQCGKVPSRRYELKLNTNLNVSFVYITSIYIKYLNIFIFKEFINSNVNMAHKAQQSAASCFFFLYFLASFISFFWPSCKPSFVLLSSVCAERRAEQQVCVCTTSSSDPCWVFWVSCLEEETFTTVQSPRAVTNVNVNADPTLINALRTRYFVTSWRCLMSLRHCLSSSLSLFCEFCACFAFAFAFSPYVV